MDLILKFLFKFVKHEIEKQNMNNFITLKQNITLKYANGTCVVSNVES